MANIVWTGSVSYIWSNQNNWNPAQTPLLTDNVTVGAVAYVNSVGGLAHNLTLNANVDIGGTNVNTTAALIVSGSVVNTAQLYLNRGATAYTASLEFDMSTQLAQSQLSGGGTILLSDSANNVIDAGANGVALINQNNTISGSGQLGGNTAVQFDNQAAGVIDATGTNNQLIIDTTAASTNEGLIEATGAAGLKVFGSTINSSGGGVISAAGGSVFLSNGSLIGGTLQTSGGGTIQTISTANILNGVTNSGSIRVNDNTSLILENTITNSVGTITMLAGNNDTNLIIGTTGATLVGPGLITLTDSSHNLITGQGTGVPTLDNLANIISGAGTIGGNAGNSLKVENAGVITATGVENQLIIDTGGTFTNSGVLSATGPAGLEIENTTVDGTAGGQIIANAPGAHVDLQNTHLIGGTLRTVGTGAEIVADGQNSILDGTLTNLDNAGTLEIGTEDSIQIWGTIKNTGDIDLAAAVGTADITAGLVTGATLTGGGTVTMSASSGNTITGQSGSNFTNSDNTISGSGSIVDTTMTNGGTIDATSLSVPLLVNTGNTVTNNGVLEANGGALKVSDAVTGSGAALVAAGGMLSFSAAFQQNVTFQGIGTLVASQTYGGTIFGFGSGDNIDLANLAYKSSYLPVWQSSGALAIEDSAKGNAIVATIAFSGNYFSGSFALSNDNGTTLITGTSEVVPNPAPPTGTTADMIMNNPSNGDYEIYNIGGNAILAAYSLGQVGSPWTFVGLGTFEAGDTSDMLLRNTSTGGFEAYYISNNNITNAALIGTVGTNWNFAGTGDFDGQSSLSELLLRNSASGSFELYHVAGGGVLSGSSVAAVGNNLQVSGFGNFSGSSTTQMIMEQANEAPGTNAYWLYTYNPSSAAFAGHVGGTVGNNLSVVGFGDLLGDGETQVVMEQNNGNYWLYSYQPSTNSLSGTLVGAIGSNFHVVGFGPLGTSGQDEMLMQDAAGDFEVYQYSASENAFVGTSMGAVGAPWVVDGIAANPSSGGASAASTAQLTQAMASFGTTAAANSAPVPALGTAEQTQQTLLTTPHA